MMFIKSKSVDYVNDLAKKIVNLVSQAYYSMITDKLCYGLKYQLISLLKQFCYESGRAV